MRRTLSLLFVLTSLALVPAPAFAYIDLSSDGGFTWDFVDVSDFSDVGAMGDGTSDAYDTCFRLTVGGTTYNPDTGSVTMSFSGQQLEFPEESIAGLQVKRIVYVPSSGGDFARYLEVLSNPGTTDITTTVDISGNLGSDTGTNITSTSSGDTSVSTADVWFATDDSEGSGDPALAFVVSGTSSSISTTNVSVATDNIDYAWSVTVPAGGRIAIMHFAVMKSTRADSWAEAMRLMEAPDDVMVGLDDYLDDIQNFAIATEGAPRVRFTGPYAIDEGGTATLDASVEDLEGDTFEFSWDLDDDGTFGEMPGATSYTIPEGTTDGPGSLRVGIQAIDSAGNTTERHRTVQIQNVSPSVTSEPPLTTSVGAHLAYMVVVEDPAGDLDPPTFSIVEGAEGMTISPEGLLEWTPTDDDATALGHTLSVRIAVDDGDGGTTEQSWEMRVAPNQPPTPPTPAYPVDMISIADPTSRLATANAHDLDLDPLQYIFEIDTVDTFDSPELRQSGPIDEMPGFTSWQIDEPLDIDRVYYWRVRANDGIVDSEIRQTGFYLVHDPSLDMADAGMPDGGTLPSQDGSTPVPDAGTTAPSSGGCSVSASHGGSAAWLLGGLAALAIVLRRRRR